jgi:hypothetical protein
MTKLSDYNVLSIDIDWCQSHFHLNKLNRLFYDKIDKAKKIVFAKHHHQIIPEIANESNIILHNIDHHHDIQFEEWQIPQIQNGIATHGCWIGNLIQYGKIKKYYWYKNLDSSVDFTDFVSQSVVNNKLAFSIEDELTEAEKIESYDLIFVCHSPEYIRSEVWSALYRSYFDCCMALYNSKTTTNKLEIDMKNTPIFMTIDETKWRNGDD